MLEQIILGIIQGVAEWLPVSSEGLIVLVSRNFFGNEQSIEEIIKTALFLHLGTFLAALVYFRKDVWSLVTLKAKKVLIFLIIATLISSFFGFILLRAFIGLEEKLILPGKLITLIIGCFLLITAFLQIKITKGSYKRSVHLKKRDGFLLGLVQGLSVLPGFSRSGLTISVLLLRKFQSSQALKLSFLMSLPIVLGGNLVLNLDQFVLTGPWLWGVLSSFIFGLLTIGLLLKIAKRINFGYFVLIFGLLVLMSVFI